ncbi:hypothetical protein [Sporosarcina sp. FSL W7-1283]
MPIVVSIILLFPSINRQKINLKELKKVDDLNQQLEMDNQEVGSY